MNEHLATASVVDAPVTASDPTHAEPRARTRRRLGARIGKAEALVAIGLFAAFAAVVLAKAPQLLEPDDYAYRASIVALTQGHLTLTNTQYLALAKALAGSSTSSTGAPFAGQGIMQWVHLTNGNWVSEKNPGYPFLAAPFQALGVLRLAPLFYGALGALGLFFGARRWLGRWGGTWAVGLFVSSGAALVFAWRATMPTFTDASLIAAGLGALLWTALARERSVRRRITIGLLGFVAVEAAVAVRYTNVVFLIVVAAASLYLTSRSGLPRRALAIWLSSVAAFVALVLAFDQAVYGNAFKTGYSSGEITFSLKSVGPNLSDMPAHLIKSMPMILLGLLAIGWIGWRALRSRNPALSADVREDHRRDAAVALVLGAGWFGLWALYSAYDWTVGQAAMGSAITVHVIRFYVPAIGAISLLAAWLFMQLPRWLPALGVTALLGLGVTSFHTMAGVSGGFGGGPAGVPNGQLPELPNGAAPTGVPNGPPPSAPNGAPAG